MTQNSDSSGPDSSGPFVIACYARAPHAREAIADLLSAGVEDDAIGLLTRDEGGCPEYKTFKEIEQTHLDRGAALGAVAGAGGGALWALGIAAGVLPAIGPVVAGGALAAAIGSAGAGTNGGGLARALVSLGFTDEQAARAADALRGGRTVLAVSTLPLQLERVREILRRHPPHRQPVSRPSAATDFA